jgi:hypothetical protein
MLKIKRATPTTIIADPRAREPAHFTTEASKCRSCGALRNARRRGGAALNPQLLGTRDSRVLRGGDLLIRIFCQI